MLNMVQRSVADGACRAGGGTLAARIDSCRAAAVTDRCLRDSLVDMRVVTYARGRKDFRG